MCNLASYNINDNNPFSMNELNSLIHVSSIYLNNRIGERNFSEIPGKGNSYLFIHSFLCRYR